MGGLKNRYFFSHSSEGYGVQDQGAGRFSVWWGLLPDLQTATFLLYPHMGKREREHLSCIFSYKGTNAIDKGSTLMT